jgi:hypothetical protein
MFPTSDMTSIPQGSLRGRDIQYSIHSISQAVSLLKGLLLHRDGLEYPESQGKRSSHICVAQNAPDGTRQRSKLTLAIRKAKAFSSTSLVATRVVTWSPKA